MKNLFKLAVPVIAASLLLPVVANDAFAHPGHDPFEVLEKKNKNKPKAVSATGPVIFSSIQTIEQSSTLELWAGLRYKAYYHLTISGKRNHGQEAIKRTFTFEVANDRKDLIRQNRGFEAKGALSAKDFSRRITGCNELAKKAMSNPAKYDFRVENRGRSKAACRLLMRKADTKAKLAKKASVSTRGSV